MDQVCNFNYFTALDVNFGYVCNELEALEVLREFETVTTSKFCVFYCKNFARKDEKKHKVYFEDAKSTTSGRIEFDGVPFVINGRKVYECHHGIDRNKADKRRYLEKTQETCDHFTKKRRFLVQNTKKFGCPAQVIMREVIRFPGYKIDKNAERTKRFVSERLRRDIEKGCANGETRVYIEFPKTTDHQGHPIGEASGFLQQIDSRLLSKIQKLATTEGITSVNEMKRHLNTFVKHELFHEDDTPSILNRRFFPSKMTIKNHMYRAFIKEQLSNIDQQNLEKKIEIWQKERANDKFKFRPYVEEEKDLSEACDGPTDDANDDVKINLGKRGLLFVHQTEWQQELMLRYGNELSLLDATYKTTKYALPLYFVVVKTNIDYQVVGSFVIQSETSEAIKEALVILRDWSNNKWSPAYFMVDCAEEEITAIQEIFSKCQVYICDFHREQAWERWFSIGTNRLTEKKNFILAKLRAIAKSRTEQECNAAVESLKSTREWKTSNNLRNWIENTWLRQKKRWVWAYRRERLLVSINTNNGVKQQNKMFKYHYLVGKLKSTLSHMITVLIEDFLPDKFNRYTEGNCRCSSRFKEYNTAIPEYLHNRPAYVIKHCLDRIGSAQDFTRNDITEEQNNTFKVKSGRQVYEVKFGTNKSLPNCQCLDWERTRVPCKHFFAIFKCFPKWNFNDLPEHYRQSPFLTLDENVMFGTVIAPSYEPKLAEDSISNQEHITDSPSVQIPRQQQQCKSKPIYYTDIPQRKRFFKTAATKCRDILNELKNLTYLTEDVEVVEEVNEMLLTCLEKLKGSAPKSNHLILETTCNGTVKKPTPKSASLNAKKYTEIPKPREKKHPYSGRVGEKAQTMKWLFNVNTPEPNNEPPTKKKKKESKADSQVIEEKLPAEITNEFNEEYFEVHGIKDNTFVEDSNDESVGAEMNEEGNDDSVGEEMNEEGNDDSVGTETDEEGNDDSAGEEIQVEDSSDDDIQYVGTEHCSQSTLNKRPKLVLSPSERSAIRDGKMLTDESINIAQNLLSKQFPTLQGLENSTFGPVGGFSVFRGQYIQILHTGKTHWVCCSNINERLPDICDVDYYDSLSRGTITLKTKQQIAQFLYCREPELNIYMSPVQQQTNGTNCGVFAIAYATTLAFQQNPTKVNYNEMALRSHLLKCFDENKMSPFPTLPARIMPKRCLAKTIQVEILCSCRMPWNPYSKDKTKRMAECKGCLGWFHQDCERIEEGVFQEEQEWVCSKCTSAVN